MCDFFLIRFCHWGVIVVVMVFNGAMFCEINDIHMVSNAMVSMTLILNYVAVRLLGVDMTVPKI